MSIAAMLRVVSPELATAFEGRAPALSASPVPQGSAANGGAPVSTTTGVAATRAEGAYVPAAPLSLPPWVLYAGLAVVALGVFFFFRGKR